MNKSDSLDTFDGFTRKAADAGMFNNEQLGHMQYLSSLPRERKCKCGWYTKWDCYNCNHDELVRRGGKVEHDWEDTRLTLPDGQKVDYSGLCKWLRANPDA